MTWFEKSKVAIHKLSKDLQRIDFEWLDPRHNEMRERFDRLAKKKGFIKDDLGSLCDIFNGITADQYMSSGIPIIKLRNVTNEGIDWDTDYVLREFYDKHQDCHVKSTDILVTATGDGTIGRVAIIDRDASCMIAVDVIALRVKTSSKILPRYIVYYLRSIFGQMQFERHTVGSTGQTHLRDVDKVLILYPESTTIQQEIVNAVEHYLQLAIQCKQDYLTNIQKARIEFIEDKTPIMKSKFFTYRLSRDDSRVDYEWLDPRHKNMNIILGRMAKDRKYKDDILDSLCWLFDGKTANQYVTSGIPIVKVRNVTGEGINWNTDYILRAFYEANPSIHLKRDDILITSTGEGTIGRVDILDQDIPCICDGHVTVLRVKDRDNKVLSRFVLYYLRSTFGQMQFERYTVGSTGQTELNEDDVRKVRIIYPPSITEQQQLVDKAQKYEKIAISAKEQYNLNLEKAELQFAQLLEL